MTNHVSNTSIPSTSPTPSSWLPSFRKVVDAVALIGLAHLVKSTLSNATSVSSGALYLAVVIGGAFCLSEAIKQHFRSKVSNHAFDHGYLRGNSDGMKKGFSNGWKTSRDFLLCEKFVLKYFGFKSFPPLQALKATYNLLQKHPRVDKKTLEDCYDFLRIRLTATPPYTGLLTSETFERLIKIARSPRLSIAEKHLYTIDEEKSRSTS